MGSRFQMAQLIVVWPYIHWCRASWMQAHVTEAAHLTARKSQTSNEGTGCQVEPLRHAAHLGVIFSICALSLKFPTICQNGTSSGGPSIRHTSLRRTVCNQTITVVFLCFQYFLCSLLPHHNGLYCHIPANIAIITT